jgi:hypothetical protein
MFDCSIWTILRVIYSLIFTIACNYTIKYFKTIKENEKCPLSDNWKTNNGLLAASLLLVIGAINIFIPVSNFLSKLPIIGSSYVILFVMILFLLIFTLNRLAININERDDIKCEMKTFVSFTEFWVNRTFLEDVYITIGISMIFLYL